MARSIISLLLACFFLTGNVILPLGDFSLMRDLPGMYRDYCKVKKGKPDVVDFVGDYLLRGKDILGHNKNDLPVKQDGSLQFRHQPSISLYFTRPVCMCTFSPGPHLANHSPYGFLFYLSEYCNEHFRPPLVWSRVFFILQVSIIHFYFHPAAKAAFVIVLLSANGIYHYSWRQYY